MREAVLTELSGVTVVHKQVGGGHLTLVLEGGEEIALRCVCQRHHFLVATHERGEEGVLRLVCHHCRRREVVTYRSAPT